MKKFLVGLALGFLLGIGAAYGGFVAWNKYSPMLPWNSSAIKPAGTLPPSGIPNSLPIYHNAQLTSREYSNGILHLTYTTSDPAESAIAYYRQQLPLTGWDAQVDNSSQSLTSRSEDWVGKKGDERCRIVVLSFFAEKKTEIKITYHLEELKPIP